MMHYTSVAVAALLALSGLVQAQDKWVVGQSAPLSGQNAKFGQDIRDGAAAYFSMVNATGGVQGRSLELITLDDKNDRKQAGENAKTLLANKDLLALFGFASATLSLDAMPQAVTSRVPFFAPFSGASAVRVNNPVLFTLRASYEEELDKMLTFWTNLGVSRVVVVHYNDEVGKQNLEVVTQKLKKIKLEPLALPLARNAVVGAAEVQALIALQPGVIINTVLSGPAGKLQKDLFELKRVIPTSSLSFVGADQFITATGPAGAGVSISQVVPNASSPLPAVRECAKALEAAGSKVAMNSTQLEACLSAKVLVEGIRRARKPVTAQSVLAALSNLGVYDLGGYSISFAPGAQHGSKFVDLAMVSREGRLLSR